MRTNERERRGEERMGMKDGKDKRGVREGSGRERRWEEIPC